MTEPERRNGTESRLSTLERDARDHAKSLSEIVHKSREIEERLKLLETAAQMRAVVEAREEERDKRLYERLDNIELDLKSIRGVGSRVMWIMATAVLGAFTAFMLGGGLAP